MTDKTRELLMTREDAEEMCDQTEPDLSGAVLRGLDLSGLALVDFIFRKADLTGANLEDCGLHNADFTGAIMVNTIMAGTEATNNADFTDAVGFAHGGIDGRGHHFFGIWFDGTTSPWDSHTLYKGWMVKAGCRWFTLDQAREHWSEDYDSDGVWEECSALVEKIADTPPPIVPR